MYFFHSNLKVRNFSQILFRAAALKRIIFYLKLHLLIEIRVLPLPQGVAQRRTSQRLYEGGGSQMFGWAMHLHIHTSLSAELHPRLRETARYLQAFV
jgi:hypothetical protein